MEDYHEEKEYKQYDYAHHSLGSKPAITTEIIDTQIANILDLLNKYPNISTEQLKLLENKIKEKIQEKEDKYLVPSTNQQTTARRVNFVEGTKHGGKKRKTRKVTGRYRKRIGGMETAENVYFPKVSNVSLPSDPTKIPQSFQNPKNRVISIPEENIYIDVAQGMEESRAPTEGEVLGTIGKERDPFTRAYHKMGKLIGTRPKSNTLKSLDFDLTIFNNTCLKNVPLTTEEIAIFKSFDKKLIKSKLNLYCNVREKLFQKDIHFDTKYPKIFQNMLQLVFSSDNAEQINQELKGILFRDRFELEDYDEQIILTNLEPSSEYIANVENILPREDTYKEELVKKGGRKTRVKKRNTKRKSRKN